MVNNKINLKDCSEKNSVGKIKDSFNPNLSIIVDRDRSKSTITRPNMENELQAAIRMRHQKLNQNEIAKKSTNAWDDDD